MNYPDNTIGDEWDEEDDVIAEIKALRRRLDAIQQAQVQLARAADNFHQITISNSISSADMPGYEELAQAIRVMVQT